MSPSKFKIPDIPEEERTPMVTTLLEILRLFKIEVQELRDEIARLKGQKPKPQIKPSILNTKPDSDKNQKSNKGKKYKKKTSKSMRPKSCILRIFRLEADSRATRISPFRIL